MSKTDFIGHPISAYGMAQQTTQLRQPKIRSAPESVPANLTFATPPAWMSVNEDEKTPNCQRSRFWDKSWSDNLWDLDLRDGDTAENDEYAANLCAGCPIIDACREAAMEEEGSLVARNRYLIRGGMTPEGRFKLAAQRRTCPSGKHSGEMAANERGDWYCKACQRERKRESYAPTTDVQYRSRDLGDGCGYPHEGECAWYLHPNGAMRCKGRRNAVRRDKKERDAA